MKEIEIIKTVLVKGLVLDYPRLLMDDYLFPIGVFNMIEKNNGEIIIISKILPSDAKDDWIWYAEQKIYIKTMNMCLIKST